MELANTILPLSSQHQRQNGLLDHHPVWVQDAGPSRLVRRLSLAQRTSSLPDSSPAVPPTRNIQDQVPPGGTQRPASALAPAAWTLPNRMAGQRRRPALTDSSWGAATLCRTPRPARSEALDEVIVMGKVGILIGPGEPMPRLARHSHPDSGVGVALLIALADRCHDRPSLESRMLTAALWRRDRHRRRCEHSGCGPWWPSRTFITSASR